MHQYRLAVDDTPVPSTEDAERILDGLNPAQREAAATTEGAVLIIAGPGSGKTRTLTHRIAYLMGSSRARPHDILAITFTNKAAREMRNRVLELVGADKARGMAIGTFHSVFARLLRAEASKLGYTSDFSIYDSDDTQRALRELMDRYNIDSRQFSPRSMYSLISGAKNRLVGPSEFEKMAVGPAQEKAAILYGPYLDLLRRSNAMDFDDLLIKPIELFRKDPPTLDRYQQRWRYLHIDEYQDTNHAQYTLAKLLAKQHGNICVVGDDAQSIYAFRGADISNILSFQRDYPDATTLRLEQNYRSTKHIVRLADAIIKGNRNQLEKELWTDNEQGPPILVLEALSERDEAQKVERRIRDLCVRQGLRYGEVAVLYRTNAQSRSLEEALRREDVPYRIVGGVSFYQRREIKDAVAYLRLVVNPDDVGSMRRVINFPTRGIGNKTQDRFFSWADHQGISAWEALHRVDEVPELSSRAKKAITRFKDIIAPYVDRVEELSAVDLARSLIDASGLFQDLMREHTPENLVRQQNLEELLSAIGEFSDNPDTADTLSAFLQEVSLLTDADQKDDNGDKVTLMTMHASKGLEFKAVFVTGLEEGLFPLSAAAQDPDELEEERRLFYVGATRAEKQLFLAYARSRYRYGEQQSLPRSRFLDELGGDLLRTETGDPFDPKADRFRTPSGPSYGDMDPYYYRRNLRGETKKPAKTRTFPKRPAEPKGRHVVYDQEHSGEIAAGMKVEHPIFGQGKVLSREGNGLQAKVVVFFKEVGQKKLMLRLANLQRVE